MVYRQNNKNQTDGRLLISNNTCHMTARVNELIAQNSIKKSLN